MSETPTAVPQDNPEDAAYYEAHMHGLISVVQTLVQIDLDYLEATIAHAETVAPVLDPIAYRNGAGSLRDQHKLVAAAKAMRETAGEISEQGLREAIKRDRG